MQNDPEARTPRTYLHLRLWLLVATVLAAPLATRAESNDASTSSAPLPVKVMIINMFGLEAAPWLHALGDTRAIAVQGLSADYPDVHCTSEAVCQMTTGMGHANAAASIMALLDSPQFDLRRTYFLIAGIAGIDPHHGTIGSAAWARYVVDLGIAHEIDARELPPGWQDGYFGVDTDGPTQKPGFAYRTEVFRLDESLLKAALSLSRTAVLEDSDDVRAYRSHYPESPANAPPQVIECDTATADTWWTGARLGEHASRWTRLLTDGFGDYCTTQQEDSATLVALTRGARSGRIDLARIAVLRTGSDFDRPYPHQSAFGALHAQRALNGAIRISTDNLVFAGRPLIDTIVQHWDQWQSGVPALLVP